MNSHVSSPRAKFLLKKFLQNQNPLTIGVTTVTIQAMEEPRVAHSIKIKLSILRKGKVAAVIQNKTLGQWLEEAIVEKIDREKNK